MIATLTSKAQITLPKGIRELLALKPGDKVDFTPELDGRITVTKAARASQTSFAKLRGMLHKPARAYSIEEMNQAVQDSAAARVALVKPVKRSKA
jgi:AbrB family looped-hinge helix DNA binding protein